MAKKSAKPVADMKKVGHYSFIVGIVIAVIIALFPTLKGKPAVVLMVVLGVIVGLLNITTKEVSGFLIAAMALIIASSASALSLAVIWTGLTSMLGNVIIFVAPAAIIVALKAIYALAEAK